VIGAALALIVAVAALPYVLRNEAVPAWQRAAQQSSPVSLAPNRTALPEVSLTAIATPASVDQPPASAPSVDSVNAAALVAGEDFRLRNLIHHIGRLVYPAVMPAPIPLAPTGGGMRNTLPTLVLPGPGTYSVSDLQSAGAALPLNQGGFILVDSVLVGPGATLNLGGAGLPTLLMGSSSAGFTSLVTWGGSMRLAGDSDAAPLTIIGWDSTAHKPAADDGNGRPYIRAVGGRLDLDHVRVSNLGFWSGRTGGVAWTGITSRVATGSATSSTFENDTYGAFVARASGVQFSNDLFEANELDGLRLHRSAVHSSVARSAAARNGGNGFVVSRGATGNVLQDDLAVNNRGNGFLIDGMPLVLGASPSGDNAVAATGTVVEDSEARGNAKTGILLEGGSGTIVQRNIVCADVTGIAVRAGATETMLIDNEVRCGGRVALSIGPGVTGTTVMGNTFSGARIGLLIRNSSGVRIIGNRFDHITVFGISVRGLSPGVVGNDNVIAGRGFQPIDVRAGAANPDLVSTDTSGWQHRSSLSLLSQLRYHPILTTWLVILLLVALSSIVARSRRRPARPYMFTVPWKPAAQYANGSHPIASLTAINGTAPARRAAPRRRSAQAQTNGRRPPGREPIEVTETSETEQATA
jgi:parallel beta-helix repeat protein